MATLTFGNGGTYASFQAALTAANDGDDLTGIGPFTENSTTNTVGNKNLTITFVGGEYLFDGQAATATWLNETDADGLTLVGNNLLRVTGYTGTNVAYFSGEDDLSFSDFIIESFGSVATTRGIWCNAGDRITFDGITVRNSVDVGANTLQCIAITGAVVYEIKNCVISGNTATGGILYGVLTDGTDRYGTITDNTIHTNSCNVGFGIYCEGPGAGVNGQATAVRRNHLYGNTGMRGIDVLRGTWYITDNLIHNFVGAVDALRFRNNVPDPSNAISQIINNTIYGSGFSRGLELDTHPVIRVYNNIIVGIAGEGFWTNAAGNVTSGYNNGYDCTTNYDSVWPSASTDTEVDPLFVDESAADFSLTAPTYTTLGSPMIDTGLTVATQTLDVNGNGRLVGYGQDRGAIEYQWPAYHYPETVAELLGQYNESTTLLDLIAGLWGNSVVTTQTPTFSGFEELEWVFRDLLRKRWLANATGEMLDDIGDVLVLTRTSDDDEAYRQRLYIRAAEMVQCGTYEEIITLVELMFPLATEIRVLYWGTAKVKVYVQTTETINANITDWLQTIAPAGVGIWFISPGSETPFGFSEVTSGHVVTEFARVEGFAEVDAVHTITAGGGTFVELYPHSSEV